MKKLKELKINPCRLIKEDEMLVIKGGGSTYIKCIRPYGECMYPDAFSCDNWYVENICNWICPEWTGSICFGGGY